MRIIVWNSQGAKWNTFYTDYVAGQVGADDVVGLLIESGWATWVASGDVHLGAVYPFDSDKEWYDDSPGGSFIGAVKAKRANAGFWVPWVKNLAAMKTNTRCSLGGIVLPKSGLKWNMTTFSQEKLDIKVVSRPVVRLDFNDRRLSIFVVHLISGLPKAAALQIGMLMKSMTKVIQEGWTALVVGDMNVDLLTYTFDTPDNWYIVNTGVPTQKSGGELDYGLLYDANGKRAGSAMVQAVANVHLTGHAAPATPPPVSESDHSALMYTINV